MKRRRKISHPEPIRHTYGHCPVCYKSRLVSLGVKQGKTWFCSDKCREKATQ